MVEEPVTAVEEVAGNLLHPRVIGGDMDASNVNPTGVQFHHEEDQVANSAEGAQGLDSEEVTCIEGIPVALEELLPGFLARAFGFWFNTSFFQDVGYRGPSDVVLQTPEGISDLGVAPAVIFVGKTDDELSDVLGLARPARCFPIGGAVVLLDRELSEPVEESLRGDDLAAGLALGRCEPLALDGEAPTLVIAEWDAFATGNLSECLA